MIGLRSKPPGSPPRRRVILSLRIVQAGLLIVLLALERRMRRNGGPGIIGFELAGTPERSSRIMERWGADGQSAARLSLVLDYPFLVAYSTLQLAACASTSDAFRRRGADRLATAGRLIGPGQIAAGAFDAAENTALLGVLAGRDGRLPAVARACAQAKFALLAVGCLYAGFGPATRLASR